MRRWLKRVVEHGDGRLGRAVEVFIQLLVIASLVAYSVETLPNLAPETKRWLDLFEAVAVGCFTVEYLLRIWLATHPLKFMCSWLGIVDLLSILPYFLAPVSDLRTLRILRLLRLIRVLKLVRYNRALRRFHRALGLVKDELVLYFAITMMVLFLAAVGIYHFEHEAQPQQFASVFHSLWWAVATLSTVGYGDMYPITLGGRIFTFVILLAGLGIVAVPAGLISGALAQARKMEEA